MFHLARHPLAPVPHFVARCPTPAVRRSLSGVRPPRGSSARTRSAGLLLAACGLLLAGCRRTPEPLRLQWPTMGTVAAVQCADHDTAPQARDIAQFAFDGLNKELSAWDSGSALSAVNAAAGAPAPIAVSHSFDTVLRAALSICEESDGVFNPLIGPVMRAWGFNNAAPRQTPPDADERRAAATLADWRSIERTTHTNTAFVRLPAAGMQLDLGAIAKGYAVDLAWERLMASGHTNLLIDLGGNLRVIGEAAPDRGGWRTGVRNPFDGGALVGMFLMRSGEAAATSGNYERFVEIGGIRYAHIMDPRTGSPVTGMAGATVLAPTAMLADALSTAVFILGPQKGSELLRKHPGCEALWIPDTPDALTIYATPGMAARLTPIGKEPYALSVVNP